MDNKQIKLNLFKNFTRTDKKTFYLKLKSGNNAKIIISDNIKKNDSYRRGVKILIINPRNGLIDGSYVDFPGLLIFENVDYLPIMIEDKTKEKDIEDAIKAFRKQVYQFINFYE